jgi:hypothetical protein
MLVYIASYPRAGNSLVQQLIHAFFQYPTASVYQSKDHPRYQKNFRYATNWRMPDEISSKDKFGRGTILDRLAGRGLLWNEWIALYDRTVPSGEKNCRYILRGCLRMLTPQRRKRLAAEEAVFFVKTHERPFEHFFEGEYVIQPVRHPGAVFRSYYNLRRDKDPNRCLDDYIGCGYFAF